MRGAKWASLCALALATCGPTTAALSGPPVSAPGERAPPAPLVAAPPTSAAEASNRFGFDLYARARVPHANLIFSPASVAVALAMASAGARGETLTQMSRVLRMEALPDPHRSFGDLVASLNDRDGKDGVVLRVANRLWGQRGQAFEPDFLALLQKRYGAPLGQVDFISAREAAAKAINDWVNAETHHRIANLIDPGDLDDATALVLTNAVYFKGRWESPFDKRATQDGDFASASGTVAVPTMHKLGSYSYAKVDGAQIVDLPYRGGLSMLIVLPDEVDGLSAIEGRMGRFYESWTEGLSKGRVLVDLQVPRWKARSHVVLNDKLIAMGMLLAFGANADFSGITDSPRLSIEDVIQAAFVEVGEEGTEAAAATAVSFHYASDDGPLTPPVVFHADHPFLYLIRDPESGTVLFIGRVVDPR